MLPESMVSSLFSWRERRGVCFFLILVALCCSLVMFCRLRCVGTSEGSPLGAAGSPLPVKGCASYVTCVYVHSLRAYAHKYVHSFCAYVRGYVHVLFSYV